MQPIRRLYDEQTARIVRQREQLHTLAGNRKRKSASARRRDFRSYSAAAHAHPQRVREAAKSLRRRHTADDVISSAANDCAARQNVYTAQPLKKHATGSKPITPSLSTIRQHNQIDEPLNTLTINVCCCDVIAEVLMKVGTNNGSVI